MFASTELFSDLFTQRLNAANDALDQKTKPPGSLGLLEKCAMQLSAIQHTMTPDVTHAGAVLFAADHGVMAQNISAYPQAVTRQMLLNFANGGAAANVLCKANAVSLEVINVGVIGEPVDSIVHEKLAEGSADLSTQSAMSELQMQSALNVGRTAVQRAANAGIKLLAIGEMGIGNTTSAAAIVAALCDATADITVGPGTGLDKDGILHKVSVVEKALQTHTCRKPESVLQHLGGLEIAAIAGAMLEAPEHKITIVVDGYIVTAAALCATGMQATARENLMFSHQSAEPGHQLALQKLAALPLLDLELRLGEGSGAILAIPLIRGAAAILNNMATFEQAGVEKEL